MFDNIPAWLVALLALPFAAKVAWLAYGVWKWR